MANEISEYHYIRLLEDGLKKNISEILEKSVLIHFLEEYTEKIRPIIKEHVERISLKGITQAPMYNELKHEINFHWSEKVEYKVEK